MSTTDTRSTQSARHRASGLAYPVTFALLALALVFPVALMVLDPTLMFERGWEQYVGTGIYFWAVFTLVRELRGLSRNERAFEDASRMMSHPETIEEADDRLLPTRLRTLISHTKKGERVPAVQLMELNREGSALDQEHAAGRFTLTRYILYLLPVIGFIGTVEGISRALMNISKVLPMVKELDGFLSNLTGVTSALQIAFDSTLLALFLSAALMLVQTLVMRRSEDLLARIDGWIVEQVLPRLGTIGVEASPVDTLATQLEALRAEIAEQTRRSSQAMELLSSRLGEDLGGHVERFSSAIDRLPPSLAALERGTQPIERLSDRLSGLADLPDTLRKGLARLEASLSEP
ncbi:MAG TPA: MotA/TolQ/ExbB proton channel family protein, partial [Isosphaeraceae bacterium]|nr:MotA/TolQ/ExbB proton channel family protein [Isosphaeraceae bacterium]